MASKTIRSCDICGNTIAEHGSKVSIPVEFVTEQTEGRPVEPYLSHVSVDICSPCHKRFVGSLPLVGSGAMGAYTYTWRQ